MASEATVKAWEDKAARQKRLNKAEAEYIVNDTAAARAQAREQAENNRQRDIASGAHERFMQMRREFIQRNSFAVSPFERKAVLGEHQARQDQAALRQHEIDMANKKNEGAIKVAEHNANGMINQGKSAAEINADVKRDEIEAGLTKNARELYSHEKIAKINADAQMGALDKQHKHQTELTRLQGENAVRQQAEANKATVSREEIRAQMAREKNESMLRNAVIKANAGKDQTMIEQHFKTIQKALDNGNTNGLTPDVVFNLLREEAKGDEGLLKSISAAAAEFNLNQGGGPKEGERRHIQGGYAVYRGGKWVKE